ncbi:hypothetical protein GALMADRAFT_881111 [Galerina marginata CBS 339.88]|uniref:Uncharacterized protein n=1 Tax=Galerina marginata (strain CBS 339.88) TaxID=685588 RepID=A0A067SIE4_GALM3|nr:hypothetical protein GALMADRAFT_881111 [Galerina marginata CBS 339.88]
MSKLDFSNYNNLPLVAAADALLNQQLAAAHTTRDKLFSQLASLFQQEETAGKYAFCLIHRHYLLQEGESMVTNGDSTQPSKDSSDNIVAECWLRTGEAMEYRVATATDRATLPPPPSKDFLNSFNKILDLYGIDVLGVCYLLEMDKLKDGFVFLETAGSRNREQVVSIVSESEAASSPQIYQTAWVPTFDVLRHIYASQTMITCMSCEPGSDQPAPRR